MIVKVLLIVKKIFKKKNKEGLINWMMGASLLSVIQTLYTCIPGLHCKCTPFWVQHDEGDVHKKRTFCVHRTFN